MASAGNDSMPTGVRWKRADSRPISLVGTLHEVFSENGSEALAVYGSLAPGDSNHWVVARIAGDWVPGSVTGWTFEITWGPAAGYQGFLPDPEGSQVPVSILRSSELHKKWREIDDFEGPGYQRTSVRACLQSGETIDADIYVALTEI